MTEQTCPKCGRPLKDGKPCPVCLLQLAASPTTQLAAGLDGIVDATSDWQLNEPSRAGAKNMMPDLETLRAAFPQLEIIEPIGRGGMGSVFKARQPKLDRFVALKILSTDLEAKPGFAERFAQEGKLLARLNHPNIVTVHDVGESGGFYYLLLELVDGVNLRQAMREERFTPAQALAIIPKICDALQYAHDEGVLHRDIKPENILLDTKGRVKIADFGIAKLYGGSQATHKVANRPPGDWSATADSHTDTSSDAPVRSTAPAARRSADYLSAGYPLTQAGQVLGTPSYMAPEQLEDAQRADHRADIYSLGVVFYELLTGELPRGHFPVPSERTPVGADIDNVVMKALHKEREKRQQSAKELKTEVETAGHLPVSLAKPASSTRLVNWAISLVVAGLVVGIVTFFLSGVLKAQHDRMSLASYAAKSEALRATLKELHPLRDTASRKISALEAKIHQGEGNEEDQKLLVELNQERDQYNKELIPIYNSLQSIYHEVNLVFRHKQAIINATANVGYSVVALLVIASCICGLVHLVWVRPSAKKFKAEMEASR